MLGAQARGKVKVSVSSSSLIPSQAVRSVDGSMKFDPCWQRKGLLVLQLLLLLWRGGWLPQPATGLGMEPSNTALAWNL